MIKTLPELSIAPDKLRFIIAKAREFDVKDVATGSNEGSNAIDDAMLSVLEDRGDDPVVRELSGFINALTVDEQIDLVSLVWLGRGDGTTDDWDELRGEATRAHNKRTAAYLLGMPLLSNHLEDALSELGSPVED